MQANQRQRMSTETMVLGAILTALVVVLQLLGSFVKLGMFSISLVLIPIVIGASVGGAKLGAWLGGVFGIYELLPAFLCGCIAIVVVSLLTPKPEQAVLDEFDHYMDEAEVERNLEQGLEGDVVA